MRNVVASSLLSLSLLAVPAVASATESAAPAAQIAAPAAAPAADPQVAHLTLSLDGNDAGMGFRAGLRFYWVEVQLGSDNDIFNARNYFGVKLAPLQNQVFSPYVYGRVGAWESDELFEEHRDGDYRAGGLGLDLNVAKHFYLFGEGGVGQRNGHDSLDTKPYTEVHLGLGVRF